MQITPIVKNLLIINVLIWVSILLLTYPGMPASVGGMVKYIDFYFLTLHKSNLLGFRGEGFPDIFNPLQLIGHFFNHDHGSIGHLFMNMMGLFFIGTFVERVMGPKRFLQYYVFCGIVGGILTAFLDPSSNPVVGASGAFMGLLVAMAVYAPNARVGLIFLPPVSATTLAWGAGIISAAFVLLRMVNPASGAGGNISHFGHLAGMLAAVIFFYVRPYVPFLR